MKNITLDNKKIVWIFFSFLFVYLILRSIFVTPYLDEITTLNDYIESDLKWDESLGVGSANNHLLNTFLCKFVYQFSGATFFWLRIPNLIAFVIFFFSLKYIIKKIIEEPYQVLVFMALNMIPWIFEYFGFIRGYALALACLFASIVFLDVWIQSKKIYYFGLFLLLLWLSFFANLSFFYSLIIVFVYSLFRLIFCLKSFTKTQMLGYAIQIFIFTLLVNPLINHSFKLKEAGALWWGNLAGLWKCTGTSIVEITFFTNSELFKPILIVFYLLIIILLIITIVKKGLLNYLFTLESLFLLLLFGNIFIIEFLASFLEVNYPRDRAAMQLVYFSLFSFVICIQHFRFLKFLLLTLIYFPISFFMNLSIYTSTYQKDHRLSPFISNYLNQNLNSKSSYSVGPLVSQSMYFDLRNKKHPLLFTSSNNLDYIQPNYLVVEDSKYIKTIPEFYKQVMFDSYTETAVFQDQRSFEYEVVKDTIISAINFENEFIHLMDLPDVNQLVKSTYFQFRIHSITHFTSLFTPMNLVLTMGDSTNAIRYYCDLNIDKFAKNKKITSFTWNSPMYTSLPENPKLLVYFWNVDKQKIFLKNIRLTLYKCTVK